MLKPVVKTVRGFFLIFPASVYKLSYICSISRFNIKNDFQDNIFTKKIFSFLLKA